MKAVSIRDAKAQFSRLLKRVTGGEQILITKWGAPVARLIPYSPATRRHLGIYEDQIKIPADFDAPLPDEVLDAFEGQQDSENE